MSRAIRRRPRGTAPWGDIRLVTPGYFATMQIPPDQRARLHEGHDDDRSVSVAVFVDDSEFVKRYYQPGTDPIGKRIYFGNSTPDSATRYITIIGVVGHAAHEGLDAEQAGSRST